MSGLLVDIDDPRATDVQSLLSRHLAYAQEHSEPDQVHVLDVSRLLGDNVSFFSIRQAGELLGVGALRQLDDSHAEIKSMHIDDAARGQGLGRLMLDHLLDVARSRSYRRVSLETGTKPAFAAARILYIAAGFQPCEPFGGYTPNPDSICMTLHLNGVF